MPYKKIWTVTGHRKIRMIHLEAIDRRIFEMVEDLTTSKIYFGGAEGVDSIALQSASKFREQLSRGDITLHVVVPGTVSQQPHQAASAIREFADEITELGLPISNPESYKARNRYMVDRSNYVKAFFTGRWASGTGHTIRYAEKQNKRLEIEWLP